MKVEIETTRETTNIHVINLKKQGVPDEDEAREFHLYRTSKKMQEYDNRRSIEHRQREKRKNLRLRQNAKNGQCRYFANWTEEISSSGQFYYFNEVTKSKQWECPKEFRDEALLAEFREHKAKQAGTSCVTLNISPSKIEINITNNPICID